MKPPFAELANLACSQFWQVTVVALLVAVLVRLFCRRRPHLAYMFWLLVILKCLTLPIFSSPTGVFSWAQVRATTPPPRDAPEDAAASAPLSADVAVSQQPPPFPEPEPPAPEAFAERKTVAGNVPPPEAPERRVQAAVVLGVIWLLGSVVYAGIVIALRMRWSLLLRNTSAGADGALGCLVAGLSKRLGVRRKVRLLVTSKPLGPVAYGVLRPTVLLPELLLAEKSPQQIEAVLAHELTHIRRHDNPVGILQLLAQAIWWFHPLVWWANRQICRQRERCCDEEVVARLGCEPGQYAQSLLDVLKLKHKLRPVFAFPGVRPGEITSKRMEEIMEPTRKFHRRTPRWCWLLTLAAAVLIIPGRGLVIGRAAEPPRPDEPIGGGAEPARSDQKDSETAAAEEKSEEAGESATGEAESPKDVIADPETGLEFRRFASLTNEPDTVAWHYALSPNGKFLLSHSNVAPVDGAAPFTLGDIPAIWGRWSPDGRKIAFMLDDTYQGANRGGTWMVSMSPETGKPTGPPERLLEDWRGTFAWSPDAEAVVYLQRESREDPNYLWVHSLRDNSTVKVSDEPVGGSPSWSPDGKWLTVLNGTSSDMLLISSDGRSSRKLIEGVGWPKWTPYDRVAWSPDSQWLFNQRRGKLWFQRVADSLHLDVNLPTEVGDYLSWTPDGKKMLFYQRGHVYASSLKLVHALSGEGREPLKKLIHSGWVRHWSPDSKYLVTSHGERFWIARLSGAEPYPLELDVQIEGTLVPDSISPDGQRLMFLARAEGKQEQYYVAPISLEQGKTTGAAVKVFDKKIDRVRRRRDRVLWIKWSPDGSRLALRSDANLWVVGTDGSNPRQLTEDPGPKYANSYYPVIRWSADGKKIAWALPAPSSKTWDLYDLWYDEPRELASLPPFSSETFTWHICELPDGEPRKLTGPSASFTYQESRDGKTTVYKVSDGKTVGLWVETLPRGHRKKLLEWQEGQQICDFKLWPDGTAVAVAISSSVPDSDGSVSIFSLPDGQERKISGLPDPSAKPLLLSGLSADGGVLTLQTGRNAFSLSIREGKWTELQLPEDSRESWASYWSPDREWFAYVIRPSKQISPEGVIWAVEIDEFLKNAVKKATAASGPPEG